MINENGGFTFIGCYKRGSIPDRTILQHNENDTNPRGYKNDTSHVDNSIIAFRPYYIRLQNTELLDSKTDLGKVLNLLKLKVNEALNISKINKFWGGIQKTYFSTEQEAIELIEEKRIKLFTCKNEYFLFDLVYFRVFGVFSCRYRRFLR